MRPARIVMIRYGKILAHPLAEVVPKKLDARQQLLHHPLGQATIVTGIGLDLIKRWAA